MAGIKITKGKFNDIVSGKKNTLFVCNHENVAVGDTLYLHETRKANFNKCGYWYSGNLVVVRIIKILSFNRVEFEIVRVERSKHPLSDRYYRYIWNGRFYEAVKR